MCEQQPDSQLALGQGLYPPGMLPDYAAIRTALAGVTPEDDLARLEDLHGEFKARANETCPMKNDADWGDPGRIRLHADACRQTYLYRAVYLLDGSLEAAVRHNPFMMGLGIRGFFENTAALGYLHNRLASLLAGNLQAEAMDRETFALLMGSKEPGIRTQHFAVDPKHVLKMLKYADKSLDRGFLGSKAEMLADCYDYLCEFAHPNFHSNALAFDLDKEKGALTFRYGKTQPAVVAELLGYLVLGADLHLYLHDAVDDVIPPLPA